MILAGHRQERAENFGFGKGGLCSFFEIFKLDKPCIDMYNIL